MSTAHHTTVELSMALDRLVPAMTHGFTILTPAGRQITLAPGRLVDRMADELFLGLMVELKRRGAQVPQGAQS
jgi:hypothetical protein